MGNIVRGRKTEDRIKAERTLVTVRAAGAFKSKVTSVKKKTAAKEIEEIIEWKFGRKNTRTGQHQGRRTTAYEVEEETLDNTDKEVIKFVRSVHVGDNKHGHVSINDTSVAWTALRESANRDRRDFLADEQRRDSGRLKQLGDVLRFLRRASKEAETLKATEEFLPYDEQYRPQWETRCHICRSSSTNCSPLILCRICPRIYHRECLESRGYLSDGLASDTVKLESGEIGWSCFICENLFDLLSDTEKIDIMETFDRIDTNQGLLKKYFLDEQLLGREVTNDSFINKEEYLDYQKDCYQKLVGLEMPEFRIRIEERIFVDMDRSNSGQIDWWQYQIPMCVRKLTARKKRNLVPHLTKQEVYKLRTFFQAYDQDGYGTISKISAKMAFKKWYLSLINLRYEDVPLCDWLGAEWMRDDEPEEISVFQRSTTVAWKDFVKNNALYILSARPNTGSLRPYIPRIESYCKGFDDDEGDNDDF